MHIRDVNHELVMDQLVMDRRWLVEFVAPASLVRNEDMNEIVDL